MENLTPDDGGDRMIVNNKLRSPNQMSDSNTMDSFQDGGQQNMNNSEQTDFPPIDGGHMNTELNNYPPTSGEHGLGPENVNRMNDNMHHGQMQNYNAFNRGSYVLPEQQHGGMPNMAGSTEFGSQSSQFHGQYSQSPIRGGYPSMGKPGMSPSRPGMTPPGMGMMSPPGYNPSAQRMMSGQSISQQGGPTPTLNQLLQTPNSTQRYQNNYGEYPGGTGKGSEMTAGNMSFNMQQSWNATQRGPGVGSYPQGPMAGSSPYRTQSGSVPVEMSQQRRSSGMPSNYQGNPNQYVGPHQFSPGSQSQRYGMMGGQGRAPGQMMSGQQFSQQMHPQYNQHQTGQMGFGHSTPPTSQQQQPGFMSQQQPTSQSQSQPPGPSPPSQPSSQPQQQPLVPTPPIQALQQQAAQLRQSPVQQNPDQPGSQAAESRLQNKRSSDEEEMRMETRSIDENTDSQGTPTSSGVPHPAVSALRLIPSPPGSVGSRSNTPASLPGTQAGSPMPPRPPSSQLDGQVRMSQSPMATQGFNQQMMPPPMGPNQMAFGPAGNKMGTTVMVPGQMGHYGQFNNQYPPNAGNYSRQQNMSGMQSSSAMSSYQSQNMYNGPNQMSGNPMYNNMPINRTIGNSSYNNAYGQSNMNINQMSMNNQYGSFNNHMGPGPGPGHGPGPQSQGPGMTSNMPTPSGMNSMAQQPAQHGMGMQGSGMGSAAAAAAAAAAKGAQAAAQAAMIAAANSAAAAARNPQMRPVSNMPNQQRMYGPQSPNHSLSQMGQSNHMGSMSYNNPNVNHMPNSVNQIPHNPVPNSMGPATGVVPPTSSSHKRKSNSSHAKSPALLPHNGPRPMSSPPTLPENSVATSSPSTGVSTSISCSEVVNSSPSNSNQSGSRPPVSADTNSVSVSSESKNLEAHSVVNNSSNSGESGLDSSVPVDKAPNSSVEGETTSCPLSTAAETIVTTSSMDSVAASLAPPAVETSQADDAPVRNEPVSTDSSVAKPVQEPITTTANTSMGITTTVVTQSITHPVTCISESTHTVTCVTQSQSNTPVINDMPPIPTMNCIPMPTFPEEPPEKKKKKSGSVDLNKLYEMGTEPDRRPFLDKLLIFLEEKGTPITAMPSISKTHLDLYKLYLSVREKGGMVEVNKAKKWKEICSVVNIGSSASAAFTLKKNYIKYLFAYECKFDKGGIDPQPILAQMEAALAQKREQKQKRAPSPAGSQGSSQDAFRPPSTPNSQGMDPFSPGMPPPYMQNSEPSMGPMGGSMMPPNNMMNSMNPNAMMPPQSNMPHPPSMGAGPNSMQNNMMPGNMGGNSMMGGNMPPNSMMGGNMPPNNMMSGNVPSNSMMGGNMSNSNMMPGSMPTNNMMPANAYSSPQNSMMGNNMVPPSSSAMPHSSGNTLPSNSESVSVQDPFADEPTTTSSQFPPRQNVNAQLPPYSNMQQQNSGNFNYSSRQGAGPNMTTPYTGMNQSNMNTYSENMNRIPSQGEQFSESSYPPRQMAGMENYPINSSRPMESFGTNSSQYAGRSQNSSNRFPFGQQFDRPERFDPQTPSHPVQQYRPSSQAAMMSQSGPEPMYSRSYGNQQMPLRPQAPQEQYGSSQPFPAQASGYTGPRPMMNQEAYTGYNNQQGPFPGASPRPPMNREMSGGMYGTPNKRFSDMERMQPAFSHPSPYAERAGPVHSHMTYSPHHEGMMQHHDGHMIDPRREVSQWSSLPQRFPSQQGGPAYMASSMSGLPPGAPGTPPMGPFGSRMSHRASPQAREKGYTPKSQQKPGTLIPNAHFPPKKEIAFPPDSVEAVQPLLAKRRRLTNKDIGSIEAWRLMMSLKSGLLAESSWALDTLNILLFDDSTVAYFNLSHLPGLLEVLLEHFRQCLIQIFGIFEDTEIGYEEKQKKLEKDEGCTDAKERMVFKNISEKELNNYTFVTRHGKIVKVEENSKENWVEDEKKWDVFSGFVGRSHHWELGGGDITSHIVTHFESDKTHDLFNRLFSKKKRTKDVNEIKSGTAEEEENIGEEHLEEMDSSAADITGEDPISIKTENGDDHSSICDTAKLRNNYIKTVQIKTEPRDHEHDRSDSSDSGSLEAPSESKKEKDESSKIVEEISENCTKDSGNCEKNSDRCDQGSLCSSKQEAEEQSVMKKEVKEVPTSKEDMLASNEATENSSAEDVLEKSCLKDDTAERSFSDLSELNLSLVNGEYEDEAYQRDEPPLCMTSESQEELGRRCVCISNIFRSLSCIPGNDAEMSKHAGLMNVLGKLLLLHHKHLPRSKCRQKFDKEDVEYEEFVDICEGSGEWYWSYLSALRENTLVIFANICGHLNLSSYAEEICFPILDGLLHWVVCQSSCARDPLPAVSPHSVLSPQRLVLEALCKLCIHDANVDLLLATPPFERIVELFMSLLKLLANRKEQVPREFAIVLLSQLVQGDSSAARAIALQHPCISLLVDFLETAEQNALQVANSQGINVLQNNPEIMGTSLDMLRRAATILLHLARVQENKTLFVHQQNRLLALVMSQILDQTVAQILSDVLFECSNS